MREKRTQADATLVVRLWRTSLLSAAAAKETAAAVNRPTGGCAHVTIHVRTGNCISATCLYVPKVATIQIETNHCSSSSSVCTDGGGRSGSSRSWVGPRLHQSFCVLCARCAELAVG